MFFYSFVIFNVLSIFIYFVFNLYFILYYRNASTDVLEYNGADIFPINIILFMCSYVINYLYFYFHNIY